METLMAVSNILAALSGIFTMAVGMFLFLALFGLALLGACAYRGGRKQGS